MAPHEELFTVSAQVIPTLIIALVLEIRAALRGVEGELDECKTLTRKLAAGGLAFPRIPAHVYEDRFVDEDEERGPSSDYVKKYLLSLDSVAYARSEECLARLEKLFNSLNREYDIAGWSIFVLGASLIGELAALIGIILEFPGWLDWVIAVALLLVILLQLIAALALALATSGINHGRHPTLREATGILKRAERWQAERAAESANQMNRNADIRDPNHG
ncbi:hypothetical protein [Nonomuraea sp. NPDC049504]|uniref:hypothetical protein n=1 Tax=Nonomuraea sp. NPDC049504 TaxID=3154729 RepID=UPI00344A80FD